MRRISNQEKMYAIYFVYDASRRISCTKLFAFSNTTLSRLTACKETDYYTIRLHEMSCITNFRDITQIMGLPARPLQAVETLPLHNGP